MHKRTKVILASLLSLGVVGGVAAMQGGEQCGWRGEKMGHMVERVSEKLELNEAQREKLEAVRNEMSDLRDQHKNSRGERRTEMLSLLDADTLDRDRAFSIFEARHSEMQEAARGMIATMADFTDSLSAEQRAELKTMMAERGRWRN